MQRTATFRKSKAPWMKVPPLNPKVEQDRNKVVMAYLLGKLLVGL